MDHVESEQSLQHILLKKQEFKILFKERNPYREKVVNTE